MSRTTRRRGVKVSAIYSGFGGKMARAVDGFVGLFAPGLRHSMQKRRMQSTAMLAYEAAVVDRMMPKERTASADKEMIDKLPTMRARSRRQAQDDGHAASAADVYVDAVVGDGIRPMCGTTTDNTGASDVVVKGWQKACQAYFDKWSRSMADASGEGTFYDLQALVARTRKIDGECFTHAVVGGDNMLAVEVIDADRIMTKPGLRDTNQLRNGIEVDSKGRATGYWVANVHPDDVEMFAKVIFAKVDPMEGELSVMQHHKRKGRAGQSRGVPDSSSGAQYLEHTHHYLKSEIIGARTGASYAMFIKKSVSKDDADIIPVDIPDGNGHSQEFHEAVEPGMIGYLNDDEEPFAFNPNRPGASDSFVIRMLRAYAASHGMSYERMTRNWGGMNYASMRGQLKEEERGFNRDRALLNRQFNDPWWRNAIRHGIQIGELTPPPAYLSDPTPWLACKWIAPPAGWIDPTKEVKSSKEAIAANLSTHWEESVRTGLDPDEVLERKAAFFARAAALEVAKGLVPGSLTDGVVVAIDTSDEPGGSQTDTKDDATTTPSDTPAAGKDDETVTATADPAELDTKQRLDAIGVAFRSGLISATQVDEEETRVELGLPPMSDAVLEAWKAEPVRRPVTLSALKDAATEAVKDLDDDNEGKDDPPPEPANEGGEDDDEDAVPAGTEDEGKDE